MFKDQCMCVLILPFPHKLAVAGRNLACLVSCPAHEQPNGITFAPAIASEYVL
jgi:hypothetical protein